MRTPESVQTVYYERRIDVSMTLVDGNAGDRLFNGRFQVV